MKWIGILALSGAIYASSAFAQSHIRCQSNIGGPCGDASRPREMNCCDYGYCQPWNSGYYQCLEKPGKCPTQETDIDYYGNDIKTIYGLQPYQCCDECAKTANCKAYTFVNENPDGKTTCYLKSSTDGRKEKKGAVSGALATMPPPENCPVQEYGIDYYGNDIKTVFSLSQGDCCNECGKTPNCAAYTYVERGADGRSECYLKTSALGRRDKNGVVSGKLKNPPPPAKCPKQETDVDYYGNDIRTLQGVTVSQCCDACSTTSGCTAYTFVEQNADGKTACYLKSSTGGRTPKTGAVSGELACPTTLMGQCGSSATGPLCCPEGAFCQPWNPGYYQCISKPENAKCPTVVSGVDFYGGDLEVRYGLLPDSCCDACFNNKDCHVFTFINYNPDGKSACYLKSRLVEQRANPAAVSGYKIKQ